MRRRALRRALNEWIGATNGRDIERQMVFYMPELKAFLSFSECDPRCRPVRKDPHLQAARSVDISAEEPEIVFQDGGRVAVMRFRKSYRIAERAKTRSGEVIQELRWQKTPGGWRIFSERDVRVLR